MGTTLPGSRQDEREICFVLLCECILDSEDIPRESNYVLVLLIDNPVRGMVFSLFAPERVSIDC